MPPRPPRYPGRPRHPSAPRAGRAGPEWLPLAGPARDAADVASASLTLSVRTAAEAAHGAFRDALRGLGHPTDALAGTTPDVEDLAVVDLAPESAPDLTSEVEPDRWVDEDGPLGRLYAGDHCLSGAERDAWEAREFARDLAYERAYTAAGAYARALRREGVGLPAALVAVRATVADDALCLPTTAHAAVQRDAARCCLEAFYAH
ncbi:hypothetical protein tb265_25030 [Gemmatimonadetes bacterium T265]|nr:hypothetical protein tb265_25030 [Gemmatimonadetes bacterium T265]